MSSDNRDYMQQLFMGGITHKRVALPDHAPTGGDNPEAQTRRRNDRRASLMHEKENELSTENK